MPDSRSRYFKNENLDLNTVVRSYTRHRHCSFHPLTLLPFNQLPELYQKDQFPIYHKGPRGVDPKPYKILEVLGDGQYKLERDGKSDRKVYNQEKLQTEP